jgi:hypothetical protein
MSSPAVLASRVAARLVHLVLDPDKPSRDPVPWVDSNLSPWKFSDDTMELTARDVWGFLKTHPRFQEIDLRMFYESLVDRSHCSGFGPVVNLSDVEDAIHKVTTPITVDDL